MELWSHISDLEAEFNALLEAIEDDYIDYGYHGRSISKDEIQELIDKAAEVINEHPFPEERKETRILYNDLIKVLDKDQIERVSNLVFLEKLAKDFNLYIEEDGLSQIKFDLNFDHYKFIEQLYWKDFADPSYPESEKVWYENLCGDDMADALFLLFKSFQKTIIWHGDYKVNVSVILNRFQLYLDDNYNIIVDNLNKLSTTLSADKIRENLAKRDKYCVLNHLLASFLGELEHKSSIEYIDLTESADDI